MTEKPTDLFNQQVKRFRSDIVFALVDIADGSNTFAGNTLSNLDEFMQLNEERCPGEILAEVANMRDRLNSQLLKKFLEYINQLSRGSITREQVESLNLAITVAEEDRGWVATSLPDEIKIQIFERANRVWRLMQSGNYNSDDLCVGLDEATANLLITVAAKTIGITPEKYQDNLRLGGRANHPVDSDLDCELVTGNIRSEIRYMWRRLIHRSTYQNPGILEAYQMGYLVTNAVSILDHTLCYLFEFPEKTSLSDKLYIHRQKFTRYGEIREAVRLRNQISHEIEFLPTPAATKWVVSVINQALRDLGI